MNQMMNSYLPVNSPRATNDHLQASVIPQVQQSNDRGSSKLRKKENVPEDGVHFALFAIFKKMERFETYSFWWGFGARGLGLEL